MNRKFLNRTGSALSLKMISFHKNADCPASQELLAFQNGEASANKVTSIQNHLAKCEFCAAEIELYAHCPQSTEECTEAEIPAALYELAEALLNNKQKNFSLLNKLLEAESIKI